MQSCTTPYDICSLVIRLLNDSCMEHCLSKCEPLNKRSKGILFFNSKSIIYWPFYIADVCIFCLLQYYITALQLLNIVVKYYMSNFSKYFHRYSNLLLNTKFIYFSVVCSLCMLGFACKLIFF